jgi:hypothetical protein
MPVIFAQDSLKALLPYLSPTGQRGVLPQVRGRSALYHALKVPFPSEEAVKTITSGDAERIAAIVAHVEDPATLLFVARRNRSQKVRAALVARAEYCPVEMHARLFSWAFQLGGTQASLAKVATTMAPAELVEIFELNSRKFGTGSLHPVLFHAVDQVFAARATRDEVKRMLELSRKTLPAIETILAQAVAGTSPLLSTEEIYANYFFTDVVDLLTPSVFPDRTITPELARAINQVFTSNAPVEGIFGRLVKTHHRSGPPTAKNKFLPPATVTTLVEGPIPNALLAKYFHVDDGFMDAVLPEVPNDLELLLELCRFSTKVVHDDPTGDAESRRTSARRTRYARAVTAALVTRAHSASAAELDELTTPLRDLFQHGFAPSESHLLDIFDRYVRAGVTDGALDILRTITRTNRTASAAQTRRFNDTMELLENADPMHELKKPIASEIRLTLSGAEGPAHAVFRDYWLRTTPVSDVLPKSNASHLAIYAELLEGAFSSNADLWSVFSTLVMNWEGALPDLIDTALAMYQGSDEYKKNPAV